MDPYEYPAGDPYFSLRLRQKTSGWLRYEVDFPPASQAHHDPGQTVRGEYYQPRTDSRSPLVVLLHGVGDVSLMPCRWLARSLAGEGVACFVPRLPVHSSRTPGAGWRRMPRLSDDEWFEIYRTAVVEVRQVVDWAERRNEIDQRRVAVLGVSFGGFISAIAMGVDDRITAGCWSSAGATPPRSSRRPGRVRSTRGTGARKRNTRPPGRSTPGILPRSQRTGSRT